MNKENKGNKTIAGVEVTPKLMTLASIVLIAVICLTVGLTFILTNKQSEVIVGAYGTVMNKSEQSNALTMLDKSMQDIRSKNILLNVGDSAESITMLYNSHREAISEVADTAVKTFYMSDHNTVQFSDAISHGKDSDILSILENGIALGKTGKYTMLQNDRTDEVGLTYGDTSAESVPVIDYMMDFRGWDEVKELYRYVDDTFADAMVENLKANVKQLAETENSGISADENLNIRLEYTIVGDELYSGACYIYFGDKESKYVASSDMQRNWYFDGYIELYDWQLDEKWYTTDWDALSDENVGEIEELFEKQYSEVVDMLNKFSADNGMNGVEDDTNTGNNESTNESTNDGAGSNESAENTNDTEETSDPSDTRNEDSADETN